MQVPREIPKTQPVLGALSRMVTSCVLCPDWLGHTQPYLDQASQFQDELTAPQPSGLGNNLSLFQTSWSPSSLDLWPQRTGARGDQT